MIKSNLPKILMVVERSTLLYCQEYQLWLGPLYIVSYLEQRGINIDFIDRSIEPFKVIDYTTYDIVAFSANVNNIKMSITTAQQIKRMKPHIKIIFGGPFASSYPQLLIGEEYIDAVVVGEGEETFYEFVSGKKQSEIQGLYYQENGSTHFTGTRPWIKDLDSLPFPALHKANIEKSRNFYSRNFPISYIITTRGCPYPCTFCFHNMGKKWRARSPQNVVDEIEWQINTFGVKEIGIVDDNFTLDRKRVIDICDEIIRRNIKVSLQFSNGVRADFVDDEMIRKLRDAGFWIINFAPESGSPQTIERMKKGFKEDDMQKAIAIAKKYGVATEIFLLLGFPWETKEDYKQTLALPYELDVDFVSINRYIPFPGTQLQPNELTQADKENLFSDRLYNSYGYSKNDDVSQMVKAFYRKWYLNPRKIMRLARTLNLFSPKKLFNPDIMKIMMVNASLKLGSPFR